MVTSLLTKESDQQFGQNIANHTVQYRVRRALFIVPAGVVKNTKIQCTRMKLLTQPTILATLQASILSERRSLHVQKMKLFG